MACLLFEILVHALNCISKSAPENLWPKSTMVPASIASMIGTKARGGYKVFPIAILHVVAWNIFGGVVMSCDSRNRTIDKLVFSVWIPTWTRCCLSWLYRSFFGKVSSCFCAWFSVCVCIWSCLNVNSRLLDVWISSLLVQNRGVTL